MQTPERFRPYVAVLLFLKKDNHILLQRRFKTGYADGMYGLVSGHIEGEEKASEAMIREAFEETNIKINIQDLKVVHIDHRISKDRREYIDIFFECLNWEGNPTIMEPIKHDKLEWFDLNSLPENVLGFVRNALEKSKENNFYSEYGWDSPDY